MRNYPKIVVPPPGPKAQALVKRDEAATAPCYIKEYPLVISHGQGPMVEDVDGNRYLDFMAGIAVCSTGLLASQGGRRDQGSRGALPAHLRIGLLLRGDGGARRAAGGDRAGDLQEAGLPDQLGHRGGRGGDQARALRHPADRDHRLSRRLPRPHRRGGEPHLQQGAAARRLRPAPAGRAPRAVRLPVSLSVLRRPGCLQSRAASRRSSRTCSAATWIRGTSPPSSSSRSRARAGTSCRRPAGSATCASCATATASCSWRTKCSPAWGAPARCGRASTRASSPTSCAPPRAWAPACRSAR